MHIIGAGGHAKVVIDILLSNQLTVTGVWDENITAKPPLDYQINGNFENFKRLDSDQVIIAIGNNHIRKKVAAELRTAFNCLHNTSAISPSAIIGHGTVIMANASVNADAVVGEHVIINTNASVDHDCIVGDFVHISPQAGLAGNVHVGEGTHIGIGASVIQNIRIGKWVTIGAGTIVIKDVPDYAVVVGNPGKIIKYNKNEY